MKIKLLDMYSMPKNTQEDIDVLEAVVGYKLPLSLVSLLLESDGGCPNYNVFIVKMAMFFQFSIFMIRQAYKIYI